MGSSIQEQLAALDASVRAVLERHSFDPKRFEALAERVRTPSASSTRVQGEVAPPAPGDIEELPPRGSAEYARAEGLGLAALATGRVALVVMAGGMATRMGGVTKALVEAIPGYTFLDLKLREVRAVEARVGARPPLWLMTSHATHEPLRQALHEELDQEALGLFAQDLSLALTAEGEIFRDAEGKPVLRSPGHGDLPDALKRSGLLEPFIARGGRLVVVTNVDNVGATLDPAILGWHLSHRSPVTLEVVDKVDQDRGGIPVRLDEALVTLEEFCLPSAFRPETVRVFSTNTFTFDADALSNLRMPWTFHRVEKAFKREMVVQFERILNEVTQHLRTRHLRVPRSGAESRFLPIKDPSELEHRRSEIEHTLRTRGILP